jgi:multiple sugar transport system permease protein
MNMTSPKTAPRPRSNKIAHLAFLAVSLLFAIFFIMPIIWSFANSFKPAAEALAHPVALFSKAFSLENYRRLEHVGAGWYVYATNSVVIAIGTVVLTVLISVPAGYGFSKFRFPGQSVIFIMVMATMMIPFQSILTPLFLILKIVHLQNSLVGLVLIYVTFQLPFSIFMMRNAFDAVPQALIEAGRIDGASQTTILRRIMLPIALPGVATVAMFAFLNSWNEFLAALIFLSDQNKFTLPIMLVNVSSGMYGIIDWGALQAGITVTMIPCLLLFFLLQRYYVRGLTAGAVK